VAVVAWGRRAYDSNDLAQLVSGLEEESIWRCKQMPARSLFQPPEQIWEVSQFQTSLVNALTHRIRSDARSE
jgi:hypothetical protein